MKKRLLSAFLAFVLIFSVMPVTPAAAVETSDAQIYVESKYGAAGSTVEVEIKTLNNPGMAGAKITMSYDSGLTLIDSISGDAFAALDYTPPASNTSPCVFNWDSLDAQVDEDGTLLTLTFQIAEDVDENAQLAINLSYNYGDIYNAELEDLAFEMVGGVFMVN